MNYQLLEFVDKMVSDGAKVILIGKTELKWVLPDGVYQLESLNDDPENVLQTTCGKYRRILSNNIKFQDLELIDGIESHCQGGIIENGGIWIKKDSKISDESYQLISKVKYFIPILYEDDIYSKINSLGNKLGNRNDDYFIFIANKKLDFSNFKNTISINNQTIILYLSHK